MDTPITIAIIAVSVITSFLAFQNKSLMEKLMFIPYVIKRENQYYRFISSGFIHGGIMHLLINMYVLYNFGTIIESIFGRFFGSMGGLYYITLYFVGMVAAGLPSFVKHQNNSYYRALGASGAVSAVFFSYIIVFPLSGLFIFPIPIELPAIVLGGLYLAYEFYSSKKGVADGIGHDAHFYGAIFGIIFTIAVKMELLPRFIEQITQWQQLPLPA